MEKVLEDNGYHFLEEIPNCCQTCGHSEADYEDGIYCTLHSCGVDIFGMCWRFR